MVILRGEIMLFRRKKAEESQLEKRVKDMKCRKISFIDCDVEELAEGMEKSAEYILKLKPVNYYAVKNEYILAAIYSQPDFSENYVQFTRISYEKTTFKSKIYALDKITLSKALAKVGIIVDVGE